MGERMELGVSSREPGDDLGKLVDIKPREYIVS